MAASKQADLLRALYQDWTDRMVADPNLSIANLRSMFDEWGQPALEPENVCYKSDRLGGVEAIWALPVGADNSRAIVYTHGGGFAVGSADSHRKLAHIWLRPSISLLLCFTIGGRPSIPSRPRSRMPSPLTRPCSRGALMQRSSRPRATALAAISLSRARSRCAIFACRCPVA
jgi:hypothetical protein